LYCTPSNWVIDYLSAFQWSPWDGGSRRSWVEP
jgi:hypothetical protein